MAVARRWWLILSVACGPSAAPDPRPVDDLDISSPSTPRSPSRSPSPSPVSLPPRSPSSPSRPRPRRAFTGRKIDIDLEGADIQNVLRLLADVGNVNIVIADDVSGSVTLRIRQAPWDQILDTVVRAQGLTLEWTNDIIVVRKPVQ